MVLAEIAAALSAGRPWDQASASNGDVVQQATSKMPRSCRRPQILSKPSRLLRRAKEGCISCSSRTRSCRIPQVLSLSQMQTHTWLLSPTSTCKVHVAGGHWMQPPSLSYENAGKLARCRRCTCYARVGQVHLIALLALSLKLTYLTALMMY